MATQPKHIQMPSPATEHIVPERGVAYLMVHILNNSGEVDPSEIAISKQKNQRVCWVSRTNKDAVIEFKESSTGSPFEDASPIKVPAGGFGYSTKVKAGAAEKHYKYTAIGSEGTNDPDVVVEK